MDRRDIEKIQIGQSKHGSTVGDIFRVAGAIRTTSSSKAAAARFDRVAAGMTGGAVRVAGDVGAQAGRAMRGGGSRSTAMPARMPAPACAAAGSRSSGDAGDHLGAPLAGRTGRHAWRRADRPGQGRRARRRPHAARPDRGLKGAGDNAGSRMIAGTLVCSGGAGEMPGYLMRRGSILLDRAPKSLSPSFVECGAPESVFAALARSPSDRRGHFEAAAARQGAAQIWRRQCGAWHGRGFFSLAEAGWKLYSGGHLVAFSALPVLTDPNVRSAPVLETTTMYDSPERLSKQPLKPP